jgi:hypothetical protein
MKLVASASRSLLLLAPSQRAVPATFGIIESNRNRYEDLLACTQQFRGRVYLEDGAIKPWQLIEGQHRLDVDQGSWHVLALDQGGQVCGCVRYKEYPFGTCYEDLSVSRSSLALSEDWSSLLRRAVQAELALSKCLDYPLSEVGGWALAEEIRGTAEALRLALAAYALTRELGGAIGLSTVTRRHGSASILRRMGGRSLKVQGLELPAYYDPQYECEMEILRFCSSSPNPRYSIWIDEMKSALRAAPVVTNGIAGPEWVAAIRARAVYQPGTRSASAS